MSASGWMVAGVAGVLTAACASVVPYYPDLGYPARAEVGLLANDSGTLYRITGLRPL